MGIREIFAVFSRRTAASAAAPPPLSDGFRSRVLMRCVQAEEFSPYHDFWADIHEKLSYLHGTPRFSDTARTKKNDALAFLSDCSDEHFLDFIEYVFRTQGYFHISSRMDLIEDFNTFLRVDDLPYEITPFVWVEGTKENEFGASYPTRTLTRHPQVIRKDSQVLYDTAIGPALELLRGAGFQSANAEFLAGLADFRKGDFPDCLTKCGSAFESVLKVICAQKGWPYKQTDTAAPLIQTVVQRAGLEPFFEQPLMLVGTLRNRLSSAHGAGTADRAVTAAKAEYAINATAAAILLVVHASA